MLELFVTKMTQAKLIFLYAILNIVTISENAVETSRVKVVSPETLVLSNAEALILTETPLQNVTEYSTDKMTQLLRKHKTSLNQNVTEPSRNNVTILPEKNATKIPSHKKIELAIECQTPNEDLEICLEIKNCPPLLKQMQNENAWNFLRSSRCKLPETDNTIKVCCGKYDNFKNVSNITGRGGILPKSCGHQKQFLSFRMVGGREAFLGEYPWMAFILHEDDHGNKILGCAGFLIHTKYVITAAHCTYPDKIKRIGKIVSVLLGAHNTDNILDYSGPTYVKTAQIIKVIEVQTHPGFDNSPPNHNDIAVVKLIKDAELTEYVQPICLPKDDIHIPTEYYLSGWGKTETGMRSKVKMMVEIPPFDKAECIEKYSYTFNINLNYSHICAGGEYMKDSCAGDSGGPLMTVSDDETWYAAGIVSFGVGCGAKGWPAVYTNIYQFLPWIKSQMKQE